MGRAQVSEGWKADPGDYAAVGARREELSTTNMVADLEGGAIHLSSASPLALRSAETCALPRAEEERRISTLGQGGVDPSGLGHAQAQRGEG